jgi:hypothetical protein
MWMLLVSNAVTLAALLLTWRLQHLQSFVMSCVCAKTMQDGHEWISFEQYLARRFKIQVSQRLSGQKAAKLKARLASLSVKEEMAAKRSRARHRPGVVEHHDRPAVVPRSALDEFPEECSLGARSQPSGSRRPDFGLWFGASPVTLDARRSSESPTSACTRHRRRSPTRGIASGLSLSSSGAAGRN